MSSRMTTVSELNGHWWYRLLKVAYLGFFLLVGIGSALAIYYSTSTKEVSDVSVKCAYGNLSTFYAQHDKDIDISTYDDNKAVPQALNDKIIEACGITAQDIAQARADAEKATAAIRKENRCDDAINAGEGRIKSYLCTTSVSDRPYLIGSANVSESNLVMALLYILVDLVGLALLLEIGRRAFYYIVLGTVRPKK